jgi:hypothetical protein
MENVMEESLLALIEKPNDDPAAYDPNEDAVEIVGTFETIIVNARSVVWSSWSVARSVHVYVVLLTLGVVPESVAVFPLTVNVPNGMDTEVSVTSESEYADTALEYAVEFVTIPRFAAVSQVGGSGLFDLP